jgi:hypothetical protein
MGGTLSAAWPLSNLESRKPKLEYAGLKKINDKQAHALKYRPRGGADIEVTLFFDAQTFQHLRTEYTRTIAAQMGGGGAPLNPQARDGGINQSARMRESRYRMVEDYSDFRKEGDLSLPHKYKITLEITLPAGSYKAEWDAAFVDFGFNQTIDPQSFDVNGE